MKRFTKIVAVIVLLLFSMTGCDYSNISSTSSPSETITPTPAVAKIGLVLAIGGLDDDSYNDVVYEGVQRAVKNLNVTADTLEPETLNDYITMVGQLAEDGTYDLIIVASPDGEQAVRKYAAAYPEQKFVIVDATINMSNVKCILKSYSEMTFLGGALAGLITKADNGSDTQQTDSDVIGIIVGTENKAAKEAIAGFEAGARLKNSNVEVKVVSVGSWTDEVKCQEAANELYDSGAEIIMCFAGEASNGAIEAAVLKNKYVIGISANQNALAPDNVIASCTEVIDIRIYSEIEKIIGDTWTSGVDEGGLREGAVDLVYDDSKVSVSKEIKNAVEDLKHQVVTDQFKVPTDTSKIDLWLSSVQ